MSNNNSFVFLPSFSYTFMSAANVFHSFEMSLASFFVCSRAGNCIATKFSVALEGGKEEGFQFLHHNISQSNCMSYI
jgi:hypothetical protein